MNPAVMPGWGQCLGCGECFLWLQEWSAHDWHCPAGVIFGRLPAHLHDLRRVNERLGEIRGALLRP